MNWRRCKDDQAFYDGDRIIALVPVSYNQNGQRTTTGRDFWDVSILTVSCDEETPIRFEDGNGDAWGWDWTDAEWWLPLSEFTDTLPPLKDGPPSLPSRILDVTDLRNRLDAMTHEERGRAYTAMQDCDRAYREWKAMFTEAMIESIEVHGEPLVETMDGLRRVYVAADRRTTCNSVKETARSILEQHGPDVLADCLGSNALKPGACKAVLGEEWSKHFTVDERKKLGEGSPRKVLRLARNPEEAEDGDE